MIAQAIATVQWEASKIVPEENSNFVCFKNRPFLLYFVGSDFYDLSVATFEYYRFPRTLILYEYLGIFILIPLYIFEVVC